MNESIELLKNYSKEGHKQLLIENINPIEFSIKTLKSENWNNPIWLQTNKVPYVAFSHILDSYDCLPQRPDMAFNSLWTAINNIYKSISVKERLSNNNQAKLSDSNSIDIFLNEIDQIRTHTLPNGITIIDLINEYAKLVPHKTLKFISNILLKGNAIENITTINNVLNSSSYHSFKSNHSEIFKIINKSYCAAYNSISTPIVNGTNVNFNIDESNKTKSIEISNSLATKLKDLIINKSINITEHSSTTSSSISFADDKEFITFLFKTILYSIRNNTMHGNKVSRLNSEFVDDNSLKAAIYIYFLCHLFLSIGLYLNNDLTINDLIVNVDNLELLKTLI